MTYTPFVAIFCVGAVALCAAWAGFGSVAFRDDMPARVASHLLALTFFALLIERAVEVIVNNRFMQRELGVNAPAEMQQRTGRILQSALEMELQQPVPAMTDEAARAEANAAKTACVAALRDQIRAAKLAKIDADQRAMPHREMLCTHKAAFAATTATVLGGLVALTGTTVLADFVILPATLPQGQFSGQQQLFVAVDMLFTALILAGGSDGIHQILKGVLSARSAALR